MRDTKTNDSQPTGPLFAPGFADDDDANDRLANEEVPTASPALARTLPELVLHPERVIVCPTRRVNVRNMSEDKSQTICRARARESTRRVVRRRRRASARTCSNDDEDDEDDEKIEGE